MRGRGNQTLLVTAGIRPRLPDIPGVQVPPLCHTGAALLPYACHTPDFPAPAGA